MLSGAKDAFNAIFGTEKEPKAYSAAEIYYKIYNYLYPDRDYGVIAWSDEQFNQFVELGNLSEQEIEGLRKEIESWTIVSADGDEKQSDASRAEPRSLNELVEELKNYPNKGSIRCLSENNLKVLSAFTNVLEHAKIEDTQSLDFEKFVKILLLNKEKKVLDANQRQIRTQALRYAKINEKRKIAIQNLNAMCGIEDTSNHYQREQSTSRQEQLTSTFQHQNLQNLMDHFNGEITKFKNDLASSMGKLNREELQVIRNVWLRRQYFANISSESLLKLSDVLLKLEEYVLYAFKEVKNKDKYLENLLVELEERIKEEEKKLIDAMLVRLELLPRELIGDTTLSETLYYDDVVHGTLCLMPDGNRLLNRNPLKSEINEVRQELQKNHMMQFNDFISKRATKDQKEFWCSLAPVLQTADGDEKCAFAIRENQAHHEPKTSPLMDSSLNFSCIFIENKKSYNQLLASGTNPEADEESSEEIQIQLERAEKANDDLLKEIMENESCQEELEEGFVKIENTRQGAPLSDDESTSPSMPPSMPPSSALSSADFTNITSTTFRDEERGTASTDKMIESFELINTSSSPPPEILGSCPGEPQNPVKPVDCCSGGISSDGQAVEGDNFKNKNIRIIQSIEQLERKLANDGIELSDLNKQTIGELINKNLISHEDLDKTSQSIITIQEKKIRLLNFLAKEEERISSRKGFFEKLWLGEDKTNQKSEAIKTVINEIKKDTFTPPECESKHISDLNSASLFVFVSAALSMKRGRFSFSPFFFSSTSKKKFNAFVKEQKRLLRRG